MNNLRHFCENRDRRSPSSLFPDLSGERRDYKFSHVFLGSIRSTLPHFFSSIDDGFFEIWADDKILMSAISLKINHIKVDHHIYGCFRDCPASPQASIGIIVVIVFFLHGTEISNEACQVFHSRFHAMSCADSELNMLDESIDRGIFLGVRGCELTLKLTVCRNRIPANIILNIPQDQNQYICTPSPAERQIGSYPDLDPSMSFHTGRVGSAFNLSPDTRGIHPAFKARLNKQIFTIVPSYFFNSGSNTCPHVTYLCHRFI